MGAPSRQAWPLCGFERRLTQDRDGIAAARRLLAYRAGWPLATTTGVTYTSTMVLLAVIGATFFSEGISPRRAAGLALAMGGVWLLVAPMRAP